MGSMGDKAKRECVLSRVVASRWWVSMSTSLAPGNLLKVLKFKLLKFKFMCHSAHSGGLGSDREQDLLQLVALSSSSHNALASDL